MDNEQVQAAYTGTGPSDEWELLRQASSEQRDAGWDESASWSWKEEEEAQHESSNPTASSSEESKDDQAELGPEAAAETQSKAEEKSSSDFARWAKHPRTKCKIAWVFLADVQQTCAALGRFLADAV